jgi:hypothetical protein
MTTPPERIILQTLGLLRSMVEGGEQFTPTSLDAYREALVAVEKLFSPDAVEKLVREAFTEGAYWANSSSYEEECGNPQPKPISADTAIAAFLESKKEQSKSSEQMEQDFDTMIAGPEVAKKRAEYRKSKKSKSFDPDDKSTWEDGIR